MFIKNVFKTLVFNAALIMLLYVWKVNVAKDNRELMLAGILLEFSAMLIGAISILWIRCPNFVFVWRKPLVARKRQVDRAAIEENLKEIQ